MYKFASAAENEPIVFGSAQPGYSDEQVSEWIEFIQNQGIQRVCCLLSQSQLRRYSNLLDVYRHTFGLDQVCWAPIEDFHFAAPKILIHQILPFLVLANQRHEKVVVHCSGGIGRTGHVLAAWLIAGRGFSNQAAISAVKRTGKNPHEAVIAALLKGRNPWKIALELNTLLDECNRFRSELA
jgi:protein-tyrosine phosphatase